MDFCSLSAPRISEERKRLKLAQEQAGAVCGVSREMWGKYERAKAAMGGDVLSKFAQAGADAQYILTGIRSNTAMSADEQVLLDGYRALDAATRRRMLAFMLTESDPAPVQKKTKESVSAADKYRGANIGSVTEGDFTGAAHIQVGSKARK